MAEVIKNANDRRGGENFRLPSPGGSRGLKVCGVTRGSLLVLIDQHGKARRLRQQVVQEPEALGSKVQAYRGDSGDIATRPIEAGNQACLDRIGAHVEDDWDRIAVSLDGKRRFPKDGYDCHPTADQIGKQFRQPRVFVIRGPQVDRYIVSFDVPDLAEPSAKSREKRFG